MKNTLPPDHVMVRVRRIGKSKPLRLADVHALAHLDGPASSAKQLVINRSEYGFSAADEAKIASIGIRVVD